MNNERNFRLATATRSNTSNQNSGGGIGGFFNGMIAGGAAGMNVGNMMSGGGNLFGNAPSKGMTGPPAPTMFNGGFSLSSLFGGK